MNMNNKALIYCEGYFGSSDGKTANGLIRHSKKYDIRCIIDSTKTGFDSGNILDGISNGIPIYRDLAMALNCLDETPKYFIYGIAPNEAFLSTPERRILLKAMSLGMNIVIGLQEFISEDLEFIAQAKEFNVKIFDIRKPLAKRYLHLFTGEILKVKVPKIAILGTDCAIGKRTTAMLLAKALRNKGLKVSFIGTGQTSIIQGEQYGVALDAIPSEYMAGEFENAILEAYHHEDPDVILYEGQSSLSHQAFISSCAIIRGGKPNAIIMQHPPKRKVRVDFPYLQMPTPRSEIDLLECFSKSKVIAITINHENMTTNEIKETIAHYEMKYHLPTTDVLTTGCDKLVHSIFEGFPELKKKSKKILN
ncbi:MAG: DUF1611 domain-containing protein [Eubacteriaceae bacterium]